ncbi:type II secretion system F family protein [Peterkaempfera griseoplana]|uniref:type II secretion system F family protein n=1 Tax=Peterkaempfera griseoplana TaxID=66896 RepID=UPI0006E17762|nr:type II secretion system F family protein [Peterkaempfera griseoplana]
MLLYAVCGAAVIAGLVGLVAGLVGSDTPEAAAPSPLALRLRTLWYGAPGTADPGTLRLRRIQLGASAAGGPLMWLFSGIPLTLLLVPAAVFGIPWLFDTTRSNTRRVEKLEALAEWTQRLADVLLLGVGLEQAVVTSRRTAPALLEDEVADLASRLQARWRPEDALRAFADQLCDATADKVLAALVLRATDRGPGLARALADMAESVREEVRQRRAIEADRAKHRTTVRWLVTIILGVVVVGSFNHRYTAPYGTVLGQLVLALLSAAFVGVILWMRSLASHSPLPRLLEPDRRSRAGAPVPGAAAAEPGGVPEPQDTAAATSGKELR